MDEAIDAGATIGMGALLAREAERAHAPGHDPADQCANCGTALGGPFCSTCGQHGHVHRTVGALFHDLLHGVLHFDGKFWATLPMVAWHPGALTRRYVRGERAKFVSPVALFLFSVFLLFAVLSNLPALSIGKDAFGRGELDVPAARAKLVEEQRKAGANVARLERSLTRERADGSVDTEAVGRLERQLTEARQGRVALGEAVKMLPAAGATKARAKASETWLESRYRRAKENPSLLIYKLKSSAYKWSWALIPLSLPFIWLLFPLRRGVGLYDHAIFATYSLSFVSLLMVVLGLLNWVGVPGGPLILAALLVPIIHIYRQLRGAYQLTRLEAVWRTWLMLWFITVIVPVFGMLLLYLGVAD